MTTTVNDRGRAIATFRHVSVWLMETAAAWTPTAPEMEAKVMLGRHIWDFAQMADALGKRTFELRKPMHHTVPPVPAYLAFLAEVAAAKTTADRVAALYDGVIPGLIARYRAYVAAADPIMDEPSVVIIENIVRELERQRRDAAALRQELKLSASSPALAAREAALKEFYAVTVDA